MLVEEILVDMVCEEVYLDEFDNVLSEAAIRQFKRNNKQMTKKFRCTAGPKSGRLVSDPSDCTKRKDPKKVRQGKKTMRAKKGTIKRKSLITKKTSISKLVTKLNARLMGK